jgi:hypothetical protein
MGSTSFGVAIIAASQQHEIDRGAVGRDQRKEVSDVRNTQAFEPVRP